LNSLKKRKRKILERKNGKIIKKMLQVYTEDLILNKKLKGKKIPVSPPAKIGYPQNISVVQNGKIPSLNILVI
jgi:hypothetical protein